MHKKSLVFNANIYDWDELSIDDQLLLNAAKDALKGSYSPYSRFKVGAAVLLSNGKIETGANYENAAYPSGICAERTAVFHASATNPEARIEKIAIAAFTNDDFIDNPISPCGGCRQVLSEEEKRAGKPIKVLLYGKKGTMVIEEGMKALLPYSFDL